MPGWMRIWLRAGHQHSDRDSFCPIRIANVISLIMLLTLLLQLPASVGYWTQGGSGKALLIGVFACLTMLTPLFNHWQRHKLAVYWLSLIYFVYISASTLYLGNQSHVQIFLLLGILLLPTLFSRQTKLEIYLFQTTYALAFIVLNSIETQGVSADYQHFLRPANWVFLVASFAVCAYFIQRNLEIDRKRLDEERARSDELLSNILPDSIAERMRAHQDTIADFYAEITVIFADIEGFTHLSRQLTELGLVRLLNELYSEMDQLFLSYGLEKIKTNGDGIMIVCGAPLALADHAWRACEVALRMQQLFSDFAQRHHLSNRLRIGIHTGSAVGGVVGLHKFSYDVWGDTVNLASRMESYGEAGKIQVSLATYQLVREHFIFEPRGDIDIRGIGLQTTYWLVGHKHSEP